MMARRSDVAVVLVYTLFIAALFVLEACSTTQEKAARPIPATVSALEAYSKAKDLAVRWKADSHLVDAISEKIVVSFVQDHAHTPWKWIANEFTFDPVDLKLTAKEVDADAWPNNQSVVLGWMFVFSSGHDNAVVHVSREETSLSDGPLPRDVGRTELVDWQVDNTKAVERAEAISKPAPIIHRPGYFRLKMYRINGYQLPIWTIPAQMWGGSLFVIRADSGEMLLQEGSDWVTFRGPDQGRTPVQPPSSTHEGSRQ